MNEIKQEQKGGFGSENQQIVEQNNYYGLTFEETISLFKNLIRPEMALYLEDGRREAGKREEKFRNSILLRLAEEKYTNEKILEEFKNPDLQYVFVATQKSYIRVGTDELEKVLSELLFNRIKENKRSLLQLVLNEAINVVPMLLPEQMDILSLAFIINHTMRSDINSLKMLADFLSKEISPHTTGDFNKKSLYQHLEYTSCGRMDLYIKSSGNYFKRLFGGLFQNGVSLDSIKDLHSLYPNLFINCLHNNVLWQVNTINSASLDQEIIAIGNNDHKTKLKNIFETGMMNDADIKKIIISLIPTMENLFNILENINDLKLTPVGIVIGATHSRQVSGAVYDLNLWI